MDEREESTAVSAGPARLIIAGARAEGGSKEDSFVVETNQAYQVNISEVKKKLNKKKLSRSLKAKI